MPPARYGDNSDPERAKVRDLQEEAQRVFRSRVANPKWLEGTPARLQGRPGDGGHGRLPVRPRRRRRGR
ncbi:MAG: cobaltochelatase subunit CobN [Dehalococcoidia bacterium]